ncbi:MAG: hypothetical protein AB7G06_05765 [Bdellovibrionales bacterium]
MLDPEFRELSVAFSSFLVIISMAYYVVQTLRGAIKPHSFSWFVWVVVTMIVVAGLKIEGESLVFWRAVLMAACCLTVFLASLRNGSYYITRTDWLMLFASLATIPVWRATDDVTLAAIWLLAVEIAGALPSLTKAYRYPFEESLLAVLVNATSTVFVLLALDPALLSAWVYFGGWWIVQLIFICVLATRRLAVGGNLWKQSWP